MMTCRILSRGDPWRQKKVNITNKHYAKKGKLLQNISLDGVASGVYHVVVTDQVRQMRSKISLVD